jgi:hypothetical protein
LEVNSKWGRKKARREKARRRNQRLRIVPVKER